MRGPSGDSLHLFLASKWSEVVSFLPPAQFSLDPLAADLTSFSYSTNKLFYTFLTDKVRTWWRKGWWGEGSLSAAPSSPPSAPRSQSHKGLWVVCVKPWGPWRVMVRELRQGFPLQDGG